MNASRVRTRRMLRTTVDERAAPEGWYPRLIAAAHHLGNSIPTCPDERVAVVSRMVLVTGDDDRVQIRAAECQQSLGGFGTQGDGAHTGERRIARLEHG